VRKRLLASKNRTGCPWQGFGSRSDVCEERPGGHSWFQPASANQAQGSAEPASQDNGMKTCFRKGRKHQTLRGGENHSGNKEEVRHGRAGPPLKGPQPVDEPRLEQAPV